MKRLINWSSRALAAAGFAAICGVAGAQTYPSKPIRFLVPYGPGGVADITARLVAQKMSENMGQQVVIDNRPSAGGIVAADVVLKGEPDGYSLLLIGNGNALSVSLFKSIPHDILRDFDYVSTMGFFDLVLLAGTDSKMSSVADVVAYARNNPGRLNIGTISVGTTQNLAAEMFKSMAGVDAQIVPFKTTPAVVLALRSGDIPVAFEILAPVISQIKANVVKALAVTSTERFPGLPNVPPMAESGVAEYEASSWNGMSVRANTPRPIIDRLNKEAVAALAAADVRQKLQELGVSARSSSPEEMRKQMVSDIAKWKAVIERAKIPLQ